jgi:hypothetical protein
MTITTEPISGLTIDELNHLTSSIGTDTITWGETTRTSDPYYGIVGANGAGGPRTYSSPVTFGPNVSGSHSVIGGLDYTYTTTTTTSPWGNVSNGGTGSSPTMAVNPSGTIEIKGEDADIKMNGKSMVAWMEKVEERLNILTPNPELEKDWDDLRRLGQRYRALEKKCKEKAQMWEALKKVQPKQL